MNHVLAPSKPTALELLKCYAERFKYVDLIPHGWGNEGTIESSQRFYFDMKRNGHPLYAAIASFGPRVSLRAAGLKGVFEYDSTKFESIHQQFESCMREEIVTKLFAGRRFMVTFVTTPSVISLSGRNVLFQLQLVVEGDPIPGLICPGTSNIPFRGTWETLVPPVTDEWREISVLLETARDRVSAE
jgi:hypothetical protein